MVDFLYSIYSKRNAAYIAFQIKYICHLYILLYIFIYVIYIFDLKRDIGCISFRINRQTHRSMCYWLSVVIYWDNNVITIIDHVDIKLLFKYL